MSENSPNLGLPYILSAQAQKHVTHNEALRALDAIVQLSAISKDRTTPPDAPSEGDRYIVANDDGEGEDNAWLNQQGKLAAYQDGAWAFYDPQPGWRVWLQDQAQTEVFDGTDWLSDSPTDTSPVGAFTRLETVEEHLSLSGTSIQAANQIPDRAIVLGVSVRVDETITGASAFEVGLSAETDKFGGSLGINLGDTNIGVIGPQGFYTPTPIIVTAIGGDFTGGAIQLALHYIECGSPQPTT